MRLLLIALAVLPGCTEPQPEAPILWPTNAQADYVENTDDAAWFIWGTLHGDGDWPEIHWFHGTCLAGLDDTGNCYWGFYDRHQWRIFLLATDKPSDSAIAHELIHADLHQRFGQPDPQHSLKDWELVDPLTDLARRQGY